MSKDILFFKGKCINQSYEPVHESLYELDNFANQLLLESEVRELASKYVSNTHDSMTFHYIEETDMGFIVLDIRDSEVLNHVYSHAKIFQNRGQKLYATIGNIVDNIHYRTSLYTSRIVSKTVNTKLIIIQVANVQDELDNFDFDTLDLQFVLMDDNDEITFRSKPVRFEGREYGSVNESESLNEIGPGEFTTNVINKVKNAFGKLTNKNKKPAVTLSDIEQTNLKFNSDIKRYFTSVIVNGFKFNAPKLPEHYQDILQPLKTKGTPGVTHGGKLYGLNHFVADPVAEINTAENFAKQYELMQDNKSVIEYIVDNITYDLPQEILQKMKTVQIDLSTGKEIVNNENQIQNSNPNYESGANSGNEAENQTKFEDSDYAKLVKERNERIHNLSEYFKNVYNRLIEIYNFWVGEEKLDVIKTIFVNSKIHLYNFDNIHNAFNYNPNQMYTNESFTFLDWLRSFQLNEDDNMSAPDSSLIDTSTGGLDSSVPQTEDYQKFDLSNDQKQALMDSAKELYKIVTMLRNNLKNCFNVDGSKMLRTKVYREDCEELCKQADKEMIENIDNFFKSHGKENKPINNEKLKTLWKTYSTMLNRDIDKWVKELSTSPTISYVRQSVYMVIDLLVLCLVAIKCQSLNNGIKDLDIASLLNILYVPEKDKEDAEKKELLQKLAAKDNQIVREFYKKTQRIQQIFNNCDGVKELIDKLMGIMLDDSSRKYYYNIDDTSLFKYNTKNSAVTGPTFAYELCNNIIVGSGNNNNSTNSLFKRGHKDDKEFVTEIRSALDRNIKWNN